MFSIYVIQTQFSDIVPSTPFGLTQGSPMLASISGQSKPGPSTTHSQSSDIVPSTPFGLTQGSPILASISGQSD